MANTLEVLKMAKANLEGGDHFDFMEPSYCTCGHIYKAAVGGFADDASMRDLARKDVYPEVIISVASALGWDGNNYYENDPEGDAVSASWFVSGRTFILLNGEPEYVGDVSVRHALTVIDEAIAAIEAEQERDRQAVLAQAAQVVDAAAGLPSEVA